MLFRCIGVGVARHIWRGHFGRGFLSSGQGVSKNAENLFFSILNWLTEWWMLHVSNEYGKLASEVENLVVESWRLAREYHNFIFKYGRLAREVRNLVVEFWRLAREVRNLVVEYGKLASEF